MIPDLWCPRVYLGPSRPQDHGTRCDLQRGHSGRHIGRTRDGGTLTWWTADEKASLLADPARAYPPALRGSPR